MCESTNNSVAEGIIGKVCLLPALEYPLAVATVCVRMFHRAEVCVLEPMEGAAMDTMGKVNVQ